MAVIDFEMFQTLERVKEAFAESQKPAAAEHSGIILIDTPEHAAYVKRLVTGDIDAKILVVSAADGPFGLSAGFNSIDTLMTLLDSESQEREMGIMCIEARPVERFPEIAILPEIRKDRPHYRAIEHKGKYPSLKK